VTLAVDEGSLHSVIGPTGRKTTFFNLLTGQLAPTSGRSSSTGATSPDAPHGIAHLGIARSSSARASSRRCPSGQRLAGGLRPAAVVAGPGVASGRPLPRARRARDGDARRGRARGKAGEPGAPSPREQRQLELAIALAATPRLLLLDEPAAGLSPDETQKMVALVRRLKGRYTIILIEHKIDVVMSMSDRISVMHFGGVIAEGPPAEIQRNAEVRRAYLGHRAAMILEVRAIDTYYGLGHILHASRCVSRKGRCALLGRNGAGKTTTLRSITGLTPPRRGEIVYREGAWPASHRTGSRSSGIALVPETRGVFSYLSRARIWRSRAGRARVGRWRACSSASPSSVRCWSARAASSRAVSSRCSPSRAPC